MSMLQTSRALCSILIAFLIFMLTACGGGDEESGIISMPAPEVERPLTLPELPALEISDARQAPLIDHGDWLHVGADVSPSGELGSRDVKNGVNVLAGAVEDTQAVERVARAVLQRAIGDSTNKTGCCFEYQRGIVGLATFEGQPVVRVAEGTDARFVDQVARAVQILNAWLPRDNRMVFSNDLAEQGLQVSDVPDGQIVIEFFRPGDDSHAWTDNDALQRFNPSIGRWEEIVKRAAHIWVNLDVLNEYYTLSVMLHDLIHALGFYGHVPIEDFEDSIMRDLSLLYTSNLPEIDGEVLIAMYQRLSPGTLPEDFSVNSLGPWDKQSDHLLGQMDVLGGKASFGTALRHGVVLPWASGPKPWWNLEGNPLLSGSASWVGWLLGRTPRLEVVEGSAALEVDLEILEGTLGFDGLAYSENGKVWGDGDLDYWVEIAGNTFKQVDGDDGVVAGVFLGHHHDAMGGVLDRDDLTAAFGGKR